MWNKGTKPSWQNMPNYFMRLNNPIDFNNTSYGARLYWILYAVASVSFLPAVRFYYVGEEAIFSISSLEMWHRGEWLQQLLYGQNLKHNPLFNWLIILLSNLVGWEQMLVVARVITIFATVLTGIVAGWLARRLYRDNAFAAFTALVYLTLEDVFFYRGWLAYVDPLFGFFIFSSIACLWVGFLEKREGLLWLGSLALVAAFLTKSLTAYAFYFSVLLVLVFRRENRSFLLRPRTMLPHLLALATPIFWFAYATGDTQQSRMVGDIFQKFSLDNLPVYRKQLLIFPLLTFAHLLPASLVTLYFLYSKQFVSSIRGLPHFTTACWILGLNYLVYWLSPQSHSRYILPLYPLFALVLAYSIWGIGDKAKVIALRGFPALLVLKLIFVFVVFPYYQSHYRGENYTMTARKILYRTSGYPLYSNDSSSSGLNVAAYLDILRLPQAPLTIAPSQWNSGFVLTKTPDSSLGQIAERYQLGGDNIYLLCRGEACSAHANNDGSSGDTGNVN